MQSNLSNYGNSSLSVTDREIYNKQSNKFNIISLKPREVKDGIKIYPKYTLENQDDFYYKKMLMLKQTNDFSNNRNNSLPPRNEGSVAGKHTYVPEENKQVRYYQQPRYFTPKLLNSVDEVGNII